MDLYLIYFLRGLEFLLTAYYYVLIAYVLLSWVPSLHQSKLYYYIASLANPYMRIFRGILVIGMIDLTPILGFIIYQFGLTSFSEMVTRIALGS
jgi:YggT family protein